MLQKFLMFFQKARALCVTITLTVLFAIPLVSCGQNMSSKIPRGRVITEVEIRQIHIGSTKDHVKLVLGPPSAVSAVGIDAYYYMTGSAVSGANFITYKNADRKIMVIYFDSQKNTVAKIEYYGLQNGQRVSIDPNITPSIGREISMQDIVRRTQAVFKSFNQ